MKKIVCVLALFGAAGCGPETEGTSTRKTVQALVTAEGGVPGGEEFVIEVSHDDNVPTEEARRLAANIRVRKVAPRTGDLAFKPGVIRPVDLHWMVPEDHDVGVQVMPAREGVDHDEYEWEWIEEALIFPHCPEGSHGLGF